MCQISICNSVSIHIRRGDFTANPEVAKVHGNICNLEYYERAMNFIEQKIDNPIFYIFTDDVEWVKIHFNNRSNLIIVSNSVKNQVEFGHKHNAHQEMYLMSLCNHNIIANSSFSWWAAWLNRNDNKIIIAPKKWFNDKKSDRDLIPITWIRI